MIAVVDDEEPVRVALERLLRSAIMDVELFESGQAFLESLKDHRPSCVVLDIHMPMVNGYAVMAGLASASIWLPIVVISGHDTPESRERALGGRASAYLRKPVDGQALLSAIELAIRGGQQP
jgi:FixJ family two-component response regulator